MPADTPMRPALEWLADLLRLNQVEGDEHLHRFGKRLHKAFDAKQPSKRIGEAFNELQARHPDALPRLIEIVADCCRLPGDRPTVEAQEGALAALRAIQAGTAATTAFGMGRPHGKRRGLARPGEAAMLCRIIERLECSRQRRGEGLSSRPPAGYAIASTVSITGLGHKELKAALADPAWRPMDWRVLVAGALSALAVLDDETRQAAVEDFELQPLLDLARRARRGSP